MDSDNRVEVLLRHRGQHPVPQNACVVHHDVEVAKLIHCCVDDLLRTCKGRHGRTRRVSLPAKSANLVDHQLCRADVGAGAVQGAPQVIHDDLGSLPG